MQSPIRFEEESEAVMAQEESNAVVALEADAVVALKAHVVALEEQMRSATQALEARVSALEEQMRSTNLQFNEVLRQLPLPPGLPPAPPAPQPFPVPPQPAFPPAAPIAVVPAIQAAPVALMAVVPVPQCAHGDGMGPRPETFFPGDWGDMVTLGSQGNEDRIASFVQSLTDGWWMRGCYFLVNSLREPAWDGVCVVSHSGRGYARWVMVGCLVCAKHRIVYHATATGEEELRFLLHC